MSDDILGDEITDGSPLPADSTGRVSVNNEDVGNTPVQNVDTESWADLYVHFSDQNINIAIEDAYTGGGGFLGAIEKYDAYSYIVPKITENFYKTRVSLSQYINYFAPYIDAKVDPVFSMGVTDYILGDADDEDPWMKFVENATNTGVSLNEIRSEAAKIAHRHQVSFLIMDKTENEDGERSPIVYTKSAKDVDVYERDPRTMRLQAITFWDEPERVNNNTVRFVKRKWEAGFLTILKSKEVNYRVDKEKLEYEVDDVFETGIDVLNVYPMFSKGTFGDYKPTLPPSFAVARICSDIYNRWNQLAYVVFKQCHGIMAVQGEFEGLRDALSNCIEIPADTAERKYKMPEMISPDPELPRVHIEQIKELINSMVAIMGHDGVDVVQTNQAESGLSKAFDMVGTNQALNSTVKMLQSADKWIKKTFNKFEAREGTSLEYVTTYPTDFFPDSGVELLDLMDLAKEFESRGMKELVRESLRAIAAKGLKDLSPDRLNDVLDDVDNYVETLSDDTVGRIINGEEEGEE